MRRVMLLVAGFSASAVLMVILCASAAAQYMRAQQAIPHQPVRFPCAVEDTYLTALSLAAYEGPFWEDGTDEEVTGIAALVVENNSGLFVERGAVILSVNDQTLVFELEALPPGERVLVLEKDRKVYCPCEEIVCYGWVKNAYPEHIPGVTVADNSLGVFCVINQSDALLERVTVYYKNYDSQSGMFIGGTSYQAEVERLQPHETRAISPYHYAQGSSRIVAATATYVS